MAGKHKEVAGLRANGKAPIAAGVVHIVQGGNSRRVTVGELRTFHQVNG